MDENLPHDRDHCDHGVEHDQGRLVETQSYSVVVDYTKHLVETLISIEEP